MNEHNEKNRSGWICPRCGKSVSPDKDSCPYCEPTCEGLEMGQTMICS